MYSNEETSREEFPVQIHDRIANRGKSEQTINYEKMKYRFPEQIQGLAKHSWSYYCDRIHALVLGQVFSILCSEQSQQI